MAITFHKETLSNGLTIIAEVDPDAHSAAAGFFVRTGARDESTPLMGVSHFLEHMMFKGSDALSAEAINQAFDDLGASNNAYTSNEMTCFYAHVLPEAFDPVLDLLGQLMRPALRQDDFDTEKGVILEEIAMYADNPFWVLYEACIDRFYTPHPLAHRVLGTPETITDLTRDQMLKYFTERYAADNTTVALAGRVDFAKAVANIQARCEPWENTDARRDLSPVKTNEQILTLHDERVTRAYMLGVSKAPAVNDPRRYAATLAAQVLGAADNSRLHWALIEPGLADETQAAYTGHEGIGEFFIYASCHPDQSDKVWEIILNECAQLRDSIEEDDLAKLRAKLVTGVTLSSERPLDRMMRLGKLWTLLHDYITLEDELSAINKVTLGDIKDLLDTFPITPQVQGRLMPGQ